MLRDEQNKKEEEISLARRKDVKANWFLRSKGIAHNRRITSGKETGSLWSKSSASKKGGKGVEEIVCKGSCRRREPKLGMGRKGSERTLPKKTSQKWFGVKGDEKKKPC